MGKWTRFKEQFSSHREAVEELKREALEKTKGEKQKKELAKLLRMYDEKRDELEELLKENAARQLAVSELLVEMMEDADEDKLVFSDIGTFSMVDDIYVNVFDEAMLHKYLKRHRQGALIKPTVHHKRLQSYIKELIATKGEEFQPEKVGVKIFIKSKVKPEKIKEGKNE